MTLQGGEHTKVGLVSEGELLLATARRWGRVRNAAELADVLSDAAVSLLEADGGLAAIRRGDKLECYTCLHRGAVIPCPQTWSESEVFRKQQSKNLLRESLLPGEMRERLNIRAALGVPIYTPTQKLIGLVQVHRAGSEWSEQDATKLSALAEIALPAIQNVLAQEQLREAEDSLEALRMRIVASEDFHDAEKSLESLRARVEHALEQQQVLGRLLAEQDGVAKLLGGRAQKFGADRELLDYLRRSREQLAAILQAIDQGILVEDMGGRLVHVNDAAVRILGFDSQADLLGHTLAELIERTEVVDMNGREVPARELAQRIASGEFTRAEVQLQVRHRSGGLERSVSLRSTSVVDEEGKPRFAITIFSDITERLKMERMREQFLSMVTHELRSPLAVIKLGVSLVRDDPQADLETAKQVLADIDGQADRLLTLIGNLLDMAQVEAGTFSVALAPSPVSAMIDEAIARLPKPIADQTNIDVEPDLPALHMDEQRMAQVLVNLLSNAYKFSPEKTFIDLRVARKDDEVVVSVTNVGPGIPEDQVPLLFRKFSKLGQRNSGTGLGLAISKHIVDAHGGRIWVESSPKDQITTFYFALPIP